MSAEKEGNTKSLDKFTGEDASEYRKWRRRAQLYLMALPTTIPEKKWGAKLLEHLAGEAEELMEAVDIDEITKETGWKTVLDALDEKYKEPSKDELQRVMREYFYTITVKEGETFRNFITRLETAYKALVRNGVELPEEVRGWMLLKKLALDSSSEAMILTATSGAVKYTDVQKAVRSVFPHGKAAKTVKTKDIFVTDRDQTHDERDTRDNSHESDREPMEVMETIAQQIQDADSYESEDALDTFEAYASVRRKMNEKKVSRGYKQPTSWQLSGTVRGRIEALKQKTTCHLCRRPGHWKKECPLRQKDKGKASGSNENPKEVHVVDFMESDDDSFDVYKVDTLENDKDSIRDDVKAGDETKCEERSLGT